MCTDEWGQKAEGWYYEDGTFGTANNADCVPCDAGFSCSVDANSRLTATNTGCGAGTFSLDGMLTCEAVPPGHELGASNQVKPVACVYPEYSAGGTATCTTCEATRACSLTASASQPIAKWFDAAFPYAWHTTQAGNEIGPAKELVPCVAPEFSTGGVNSCAVPAGIAGSYNPSSTQDDTTACSTATSGASATTCTLCPAGSFCPDATTVTACSGGDYSRGGLTVCNNCPAGFSCNNAALYPVPCSAGSASNAGQTSCNSATSPDYVTDYTDDSGTGLAQCNGGG